MNEIKCYFIVLILLSVWPDRIARAQSLGRDCPRPTLENGYFTPDESTYKHDDKIYYACNQGQKPISEGWWANVVCNDGKWSPYPLCIGENDCIAPNVPHAKLINPVQEGWYGNGNSAGFVCERGYEIITDSSTSCQNGRWTSLPTCTRKPFSCGSPPQVENAIIQQKYEDIYEEYSTVAYACGDLYQLEGQSVVQCKNAQWQVAPKCVKKGIQPEPPSRERTVSGDEDRTQGTSFPLYLEVQECGDPPTIVYGDTTKTERLSITYECSRFYKLQGPSQVMCLSGRQWSKLPTCVSNFCKLEGKIDHLKTLQSALFFEEETTEYFDCEDVRYNEYKWVAGNWKHYGAIGRCIKGNVYFKGCGYEWEVTRTP
ncbi:complement factor H-related protein 1-like isoform X2 [Denticeps clupeoides]|uniref:complement factor H-related protein 1-like isoform X2 n=1 Tax=Denticeps clupeoides TaxID=299321 RepID=UPI0010A2C5A0|nr:complement factor H-related protein 1-like isoform X2 [Denticeps clupeoides]